MKTIKLVHKIDLEGIKKVKISNELMGTQLLQSADEMINIELDLFIRTSSDMEEFSAEDIVNVKTDEKKGIINIDIEEPDWDDDEFDISHKSEIRISIPAQIEIISETDNHFISAFGMNNNLELKGENGPIKLEECSGNVNIKNENGPVKLYKLTGDLVIEEENGPISADFLSGSRLEITSENGPIKMRECHYEDVSIRNENGVVFYECLPLDSGSITIENENGHINIALAPTQGFALEATSEYGHIKNSFMGTNHFATGNYTFSVGDEGLKIKLSTENGLMKISSSDMISGDYLKKKLEYIKELLIDNSETGIQEAHKVIGQLMTSLDKLLEKVNEDSIREKIEEALQHLKTWKSKINDPELKKVVNDSLEGISEEIGKTIQEAMAAAKEAMKAAKEKYNEEFMPHFEKHFDKGKRFIKHFKHFMPPIPPFPPEEPQRRKDAMQEAARMKILEMLEAGKITAEEAEKLLKAIH